MHLVIWGSLPTQEEKDHVRETMCKAMVPSQSVKDVISAFPYATPLFQSHAIYLPTSLHIISMSLTMTIGVTQKHSP